MEYKSVWAASRFAKVLVLLKRRLGDKLPPELVSEVDALIGDMEKAVPKYIETLARAIVIAVILALAIRAVVIQAFKKKLGLINQ